MKFKKLLIISCLILAGCGAQQTSSENSSLNSEVLSPSESQNQPSSKSSEHRHEIEQILGRSSTCSEHGFETHFKCKTCGAFFADQFGNVPLENVPLFPLASHEFSYEEIDQNKHKKYCINCDYFEEENHTFENADGNLTFPGHIEKTICRCGLGKDYVTSVPEIRIQTNSGQDIVGDRMAAEYYPSTISVSNCDDKYKLTSLPGKVKVRGNYSANFDKKPYRIKFDEKQQMLGLNEDLKAKDWVLIADWKDRAMVRSMTAYYLGNAIYNPDNLYASDYRYVKVYVNNKYKGVYGLVEQQEIHKGRVNITKAEDGYTGTDIGYFIEMDYNWNKTETAENTFTYNYLKKNIKYLNDNTDCAYSRFEDGYTFQSNIYSEAQKTFIANRVTKTYEAIYDAIYTTNGSKSGYYTFDANNNLVRDKSITSSFDCINRIVNIQSIADTFVLNEIMCDMDYAHSSFYLSFDNGPKGDKKLTLQAPWDWDSTLGYYYPHYDRFLCCDSLPPGAPHGNISKQTNPWLIVLCHTNWFWQYVNNKFNDLVQAKVFDKLLARIDKTFSLYKNLFAEDLNLWTKRETYSEDTMNPKFKELKRGQPHIDFVKKYINDRVTFLSKNIPIRLNTVK